MEGTFTLDPQPPPPEFPFYTVGVACYSPPPSGIWLSTLWEVYLCQKCCICCTMFFYAEKKLIINFFLQENVKRSYHSR